MFFFVFFLPRNHSVCVVVSSTPLSHTLSVGASAKVEFLRSCWLVAGCRQWVRLGLVPERNSSLSPRVPDINVWDSTALLAASPPEKAYFLDSPARR